MSCRRSRCIRAQVRLLSDHLSGSIQRASLDDPTADEHSGGLPMPVRLISPRTGFVMVAALFLILAPETVRPQPATHSAVFKMDASRSISIWQNHALSVGTQNVLITVCVTT